MRSSRSIAVAVLVCLSACSPRGALPPPAIDVGPTGGHQVAVFAGGCFWTVEAVFSALKGVEEVMPGYAGGEASDARYELVSSGETGHAESVRVTFDPLRISYGQLLRVFFGAAHDPTQRDRQGPDWGSQYRSVIFSSSDEQKRVAEAYVRQLEAAKTFRAPIVTDVAPLVAFYPAEKEHRGFVKLHPDDPYVLAHWPGKLEKLRAGFGKLLR